MHAIRATFVVFTSILLAFGVLTATSTNYAAGQSTSTKASSISRVQVLPVGTRIPAEEFESTVQAASSQIGNTNCRKNSANPHIATQTTPDTVKTVGGVIKCSTKKDRLYTQVRLWKKDNGSYRLKDENTAECKNCYRRMTNAKRRCWNKNSNKFIADAYVYVEKNGNGTEGVGMSSAQRLNCGGF